MLEQLQAQWTKPWVTAWPIFSAIYGKTACHTCHSLHAIYGWMLESSGIHVYMTVFPCEIWVMGTGWLPWLLWTRQGRGCGGSGETCLPLAATRVARVWLQWDCMTCPGRSRGGGLHSRTTRCHGPPWPMSQTPQVGPGVCSPWSSSEFWHQITSPVDTRSQWHSALQTSSHCPASLANRESKRKFSEDPHALHRGQPLPYLEARQKQMLVQCPASGPWLQVTLQQDFCWGRYVLGELMAFQELCKAAGASQGWLVTADFAFELVI